MNLEQRQRFASMLARVSCLYDVLLETHGTTNNAVGWSKPETHETSIRTLLRIVEAEGRDDISINDFGCGYGTLFEIVKGERWMKFGAYYGYDINQAMVEQVNDRYKDDPRAQAQQSMEPQTMADYSIAAGTFNCAMQAAREEWEDLIELSLMSLWEKSRRGVAVSFLHERHETRDPDIIYLNPARWESFCKRTFTADVELIEDQPAGQFALLLRR